MSSQPGDGLPCAFPQSVHENARAFLVLSCPLSSNNHIVMDISIARQRLGKHMPAGAKARNNITSIAKQRISKHASLTTEAAFSAWSVQSGYREVFGSREQLPV
jgi:hypothetical protein